MVKVKLEGLSDKEEEEEEKEKVKKEKVLDEG